MKILLDTNVLLSAAWRDRLPEKVVLHVASDPASQWIVTEPILNEYFEVLRRPKFGLSATLLRQWHELIGMRTLVIPLPPVDVTLSRDSKDAIFLAAAIAAGADYLVTGDNDLLQLHTAIATRIVTVADFAASIGIH